MNREQKSGCNTVIACFLWALLLWLGFQVVTIIAGVIIIESNSGNPAYDIISLWLLIMVAYAAWDVLDSPQKSTLMDQVRKDMEKKLEKGQWTTEEIIELIEYRRNKVCAKCPNIVELQKQNAQIKKLIICGTTDIQDVPDWLVDLIINWPAKDRNEALDMWKKYPGELDAKDLMWMKNHRKY